MSDFTEGRIILAAETKVACESLPYSLRHIVPGCALEDARNLAQFLESVDFLELAYKGGPAFDDQAIEGRMLAHKLLIDKIEIGMGIYKFPFIAHGQEQPALVEREEE